MWMELGNRGKYECGMVPKSPHYQALLSGVSVAESLRESTRSCVIPWRNKPIG